MLYDKMVSLRRAFQDTPLKVHFKQPIYHIMVLFVDESESIARQLKRGREVIAHNEEVKRTGEGELLEERPTDTNEELARNRYRTFKEKTYGALLSLKQIFHYLATLFLPFFVTIMLILLVLVLMKIPFVNLFSSTNFTR